MGGNGQGGSAFSSGKAAGTLALLGLLAPSSPGCITNTQLIPAQSTTEVFEAAGAKAFRLSLEGPETTTAGVCLAYPVQIEDEAGNPFSVDRDVTIQIILDGGGTLYSDSNCQVESNIVAIPKNLTMALFYFRNELVGSSRINAEDDDGRLEGASRIITVAPGAAQTVEYQTPPPSSFVACRSTVDFVDIWVTDLYGNLVETTTAKATLTAHTDPECLISSPNPISVPSGVARFMEAGATYFSGLEFPDAGTYYVKVSVANVAPACSSAITVTSSGAFALEYATQPSSTATAGQDLATQPAIRVVDTCGDVVTDASAAITLSAFTDSGCSTSPAGGTLTVSTNPLGATSGVATFSGVKYSLTGPLYLKATAPFLAPVCSELITVSP